MRLSKKIFSIVFIINIFFSFTVSGNHLQPGEKRLRENIVNEAKEYIGLRYRYGGVSKKGFDCSGFVRHIYKLNGISLPRKSIDQYNMGKKIPMKRVKRADLIFFKINMVKITHVGIYIGDGKFIHSPSSGKKIRISDMKNSYWKKRLSGAVNYIN